MPKKVNRNTEDTIKLKPEFVSLDIHCEYQGTELNCSYCRFQKKCLQKRLMLKKVFDFLEEYCALGHFD